MWNKDCLQGKNDAVYFVLNLPTCSKPEMEEHIKYGALNTLIVRKGCRLDVTQAKRKANKKEKYRQQNKQENK